MEARCASPETPPRPDVAPGGVDVAAVQRELDALRCEIVADLGAADARYIRAVLRTSRLCALFGRLLLLLGFQPLSWILGTLLLALGKILENMEVGHNVLHGQYDWMNDPGLDSHRYEWDLCCAAADWRESHNVMHHQFTNIVGVDRDFGYGVLRFSDEQPWVWQHRFQLLTYLMLMLLYEFGIGMHNARFEDFRDRRIDARELHDRLRPFTAKLRRQWFKDYLLFPLLALPFAAALAVLAGNFAANLIRNLWVNVVFFCGHLPEGPRTFGIEQTADETRGAWYIRQIEGSLNLRGGRLMHLVSGHLSHQIEHHLFPDLPSWRYSQLEPRVREICHRHGLRYNHRSLGSAYLSMLWRLARHSLPPKPARDALQPAG